MLYHHHLPPAVLAGLTPWQVRHILFADRDSEGHLIRVRQRLEEQALPYQPPPVIAIPDEALAIAETRGATLEWIRMFFQVWSSRGMNEDQVMDKFRTYKG